MKSTFDKYLEGKIEELHALRNKLMYGDYLDEFLEQVARESRDIGYEEGARKQAELDADLCKENYANGFMNGAEKGFSNDREVIKLETLRSVIKIVNECPPFDGCQSKDWIRDKVVMEYKRITRIDIPKKGS
jgi:hypothetical protein